MHLRFQLEPFGYGHQEGLCKKVDLHEGRYFVIAVAARVCDAYVGQVCVAIYDSLRSMS